MIRVVEKQSDANCITHSGTMHADEVFSTAFLNLYLGDVRVYIFEEKLRFLFSSVFSINRCRICNNFIF